MGSLSDPKTEIVTKLTGLAVYYNLGTAPTEETWADLFKRYDKNSDGYLTHSELSTLFVDAGISADSWWPWLRRRMVVAAVIDAADEQGERDQRVSLAEFQGAVRSMTSPDLIEAGVKRAERLIEDEFKPPSMTGSLSGAFASLGWGGALALGAVAYFVLTSDAVRR